MKRPNEDRNNFISEYDKKKRKIIDEKDIINKFLYSYFFIDKSLLIKEFLEEASSIICVTRPSGYGKTINLTMMCYFFEMNYENDEISENKKYFENLNIAKEKIYGESYIDHYQGKYPIVYLDFESTYDETLDSFKKFIQELYSNYQNISIENLKYDDEDEWENFQKCNVNNKDLDYSIYFLCNCLKRILERKIVLLIDNYDLPILNAINTEFYDQFYSFYYSIFKILFKYDNEKCYLFKTFITGKVNSHFFYDFNLVNYSILSDKYIEYFSITDSELRKLISEFKLKNKKEIFEKYCINNKSTFSNINRTNINNINEINIIISSTFFNNKSDDDGNNNNKSDDDGNNNNNNSDNDGNNVYKIK